MDVVAIAGGGPSEGSTVVAERLAAGAELAGAVGELPGDGAAAVLSDGGVHATSGSCAGAEADAEEACAKVGAVGADAAAAAGIGVGVDVPARIGSDGRSPRRTRGSSEPW